MITKPTNGAIFLLTDTFFLIKRQRNTITHAMSNAYFIKPGTCKKSIKNDKQKGKNKINSAVHSGIVLFLMLIFVILLSVIIVVMPFFGFAAASTEI